jgi:hypothetical protein
MAKGKSALPKRVAGIKVPKRLRKSRLLRSLLGNSLGRQVVADALVAGAGAAGTVLMRERKEVAHAAGAGVRKGTKRLALVTEALEEAVEAMMDVVSDAARAMLADGGGREDKERRRHGSGSTRH